MRVANFRNNQEQIRAFARDCLSPTGRGFYLRDVHLLYIEWCNENQTQPLGKVKFASYLEVDAGFERSQRVDAVRFEHGTLLRPLPPRPQKPKREWWGYMPEEDRLRLRQEREAQRAKASEARKQQQLERAKKIVVKDLVQQRKRSLFLERLLK